MNLDEYRKRFECIIIFVIFVQSLVHTQVSKFGNIYTYMIRNGKSFIAQILKVVSPLGKRLIFFSPLEFKIKKNYDSETLDFKLHSFRAFQRYLTDKNPTHGRGTVSVFACEASLKVS